MPSCSIAVLFIALAIVTMALASQEADRLRPSDFSTVSLNTPIDDSSVGTVKPMSCYKALRKRFRDFGRLISNACNRHSQMRDSLLSNGEVSPLSSLPDSPTNLRGSSLTNIN